ncbi:guanine deaminase [Alteromonas sp. a30]|uniref:guanine deaminase n=1 Tax=Alteromonas sp. a30 TaxID=2730917 RepID=UPI00227FBBEF|nr:guanine deaminase [Alteromonas sp. a30]MCY7293890.1 guanine deaminase [Alteromonas sp. a30]
MANLFAIKANILHFPNATTNPETEYQYFENGVMVVESDKIKALGHEQDILPHFHGIEVIDASGKLLVPGFIDTHLHFPQTEMIASYGEQLLEWLENYTFPTERKFENVEYSRFIASKFMNQLWSNGTTTALAYSTVHACSAEALFEKADTHNMLMITGKTCMDRHCPDWLQDTAETAENETRALIDKWHNKGRLKYAITPRFAPTSTTEQLQRLGRIVQDHSDVFIQTHLSENKDEIEWVKSLYPECIDYLHVYEQFGLVNERTVFGHCIHLEDHTWERLGELQSIIAFCPRSNLFLGSGLFEIAKAEQYKVPVTLASDVGAGDSFSMLRTQGEAYKVCQLQHIKLHPFKGLYMMTQGSAHALSLDDSIGNLNVGSHADFTLLDPKFNELSDLRMSSRTNTPDDTLFALSMLSDERTIAGTWIAGKPVYQGTNSGV